MIVFNLEVATTTTTTKNLFRKVGLLRERVTLISIYL